MAWLDERVWCHPKFTELSDGAGWTWSKSVAYSSGMSTAGRLEPGQQRLVGSTDAVRAELVAAGLWDDLGDGVVLIHDWADHNGKRDERRANDRERKRLMRLSAGQSAGQSAGASTGTAHVDGSDGSEGTTKAKATTPAISSPGAQALVAHLADEAARLGLTLPAQTKGQCARTVKRLLADGMSDPTLRTALTRMLERSRPAAALTDIAREVEATPAVPDKPPDDYDNGTYHRLTPEEAGFHLRAVESA